MTITRPCYATRDQVMRAVDIKFTAYIRDQVDRAISDASETIDGLCHRRFYNLNETHYWDWPNYQYSYPWRIWLDQAELADVTANVPVVTSGGTVIPAGEIFWKPWNYGPPFYAIELDRSSNAAFGVGSTPQRDVAITGTFGYWAKTVPSGTVAANATSSATQIQVSNGSTQSVGDVLIDGTESMLVTEQSMVSTGVSFAGMSTASAADNTVAVADGTKFNINEVLLADSERVLVWDINGNTLLVKRAWDGTVLAAHTSAVLYANRLLTVTRGFGGTTAHSLTLGDSLSIQAIPGLVKNLAIAEAVTTVLQETSAYAVASVGESTGSLSTGTGLADMRDQVFTRYGRKARRRVI